MAHLRSIVVRCNWRGCCTARASEAVYSNRNDLCGNYCARHAKKALAERGALEQELYRHNYVGAGEGDHDAWR